MYSDRTIPIIAVRLRLAATPRHDNITSEHEEPTLPPAPTRTLARNLDKLVGHLAIGRRQSIRAHNGALENRGTTYQVVYANVTCSIHVTGETRDEVGVLSALSASACTRRNAHLVSGPLLYLTIHLSPRALATTLASGSCGNEPLRYRRRSTVPRGLFEREGAKPSVTCPQHAILCRNTIELCGMVVHRRSMSTSIKRAQGMAVHEGSTSTSQPRASSTRCSSFHAACNGPGAIAERTRISRG